MSFDYFVDFQGAGPYAAAAVGVAFAMLVFLIGRMVFGRRGKADYIVVRSLPTERKATPKTKSDPLIYGMEMGRRQAVRCGGGRTEVLVTVKDDGRGATGLILDHSRSGIGLALPWEVPVGSVLSVQMSAGESVQWIDVEVRRCLRCDTEWQIGCRFIRTPRFAGEA